MSFERESDTKAAIRGSHVFCLRLLRMKCMARVNSLCVSKACAHYFSVQHVADPLGTRAGRFSEKSGRLTQKRPKTSLFTGTRRNIHSWLDGMLGWF